VVQAATAYDHPSGETFILVLQQALYMGDCQEPSLLCPNQLRANGIVVDDVPTHLSFDLSSTHSLYVPHLDLRIPLSMSGVVSYVPTRLPSMAEIEQCVHVELTSSEPWDPHAESFELEEAKVSKMNQLDNRLLTRSLFALRQDCGTMAVLAGVNPTLLDGDFLLDLQASVQVSATQSSTRHPEVKAHTLAQRWGIGLEAAQRTLKVTTQLGIRSAIHPLHRRYRTKQTQLRYNRLNTKFYADVTFASQVSTRGNTCGTMFVNDIDFSHFVPMKRKGDAGDALAELFEDKGVPTHLHTDGAKELTEGRWKEI
jgi:hypothetical protein